MMTEFNAIKQLIDDLNKAIPQVHWYQQAMFGNLYATAELSRNKKIYVSKNADTYGLNVELSIRFIVTNIKNFETVKNMIVEAIMQENPKLIVPVQERLFH